MTIVRNTSILNDEIDEDYFSADSTAQKNPIGFQQKDLRTPREQFFSHEPLLFNANKFLDYKSHVNLCNSSAVINQKLSKHTSLQQYKQGKQQCLDRAKICIKRIEDEKQQDNFSKEEVCFLDGSIKIAKLGFGLVDSSVLDALIEAGWIVAQKKLPESKVVVNNLMQERSLRDQVVSVGKKLVTSVVGHVSGFFRYSGYDGDGLHDQNARYRNRSALALRSLLPENRIVFIASVFALVDGWMHSIRCGELNPATFASILCVKIFTLKLYEFFYDSFEAHNAHNRVAKELKILESCMAAWPNLVVAKPPLTDSVRIKLN